MQTFWLAATVWKRLNPIFVRQYTVAPKEHFTKA